MLSNILDLAKAKGNGVIVLTIIAWMTFGAMGATLWSIALRGIWTEIGAAFVQGILSAAAIFSAFWLQSQQNRTTRKHEAESAAEAARHQDRKELIFTFGLIESAQILFDQICNSANKSPEFDNHKDAYIVMTQQEMSYQNTINCMQLSDDKYISAITNLKRLTVLMYSLLSKESFDLDKAKYVSAYLRENAKDLVEAAEKLETNTL